jgi:gamma-glutamyltranspeptidase/glutathione hydrolase
MDILKKGGTAIDAAIAANAMLSLLEPHMCGPGGDLFAIVWDPDTEKLYGLNASGRSPSQLGFQKMSTIVDEGQRMPTHGPLSVTVPGAIDGWFELHDRFGMLSMSDVLAPAIGYAREGVPIPQITAALWKLADEELHISRSVADKLNNYESTFRIDDAAPEQGSLFRNADLADFLSLLVKKGRDGFYRGSVAKTIADYVQGFGGFLTVDDIASHKSDWVEPLHTQYRGYDVFQLPPNGQGLIVLQMLNILEGIDLKRGGASSSEYWHYFIEAKKLAYEDRSRYYSDPDFSTLPIKRLLSKKYAESRRRLINENAASTGFDAGYNLNGDSNTTYVTTADSSGMIVSLIQSNYGLMGSGLVPDGLGFPLQNRGSQFSLTPGHGNQYQAGKRPFHTIIPGFVMKDGEPVMSLGVVGGDMQPQAQVQILINMIDFGMGLQAAGDVARIRHFGSSNPDGSQRQESGWLYVETGIPDSVVDALEALGHVIKKRDVEASDYMGGFQAIEVNRDNKTYRAASEFRLDGLALAY